jgi:hypothetical protein
MTSCEITSVTTADAPRRLASQPNSAAAVTAHLANGGALEHAQEMAAYESPRTTKLYDRTADVITLDEVERIVI